MTGFDAVEFAGMDGGRRGFGRGFWGYGPGFRMQGSLPRALRFRFETPKPQTLKHKV